MQLISPTSDEQYFFGMVSRPGVIARGVAMWSFEARTLVWLLRATEWKELFEEFALLHACVGACGVAVSSKRVNLQ